MTDIHPQPAAQGAERRYTAALDHGRFEVPRCDACGALHFPPRVMCPHCAGTAFAWVAPSGLGTVQATTVVRRKAGEGGELGLCLIDLEEGLRLLSRVEGIAPGEVRIGQRVVARLRADAGAALLVFVPEGAPR